jgi:hypothetical protein
VPEAARWTRPSPAHDALAVRPWVSVPVQQADRRRGARTGHATTARPCRNVLTAAGRNRGTAFKLAFVGVAQGDAATAFNAGIAAGIALVVHSRGVASTEFGFSGLPVGKRVRSEPHSRDRRRSQLSVRLQTSVLLELFDRALRALPPDPIDGASVEAQTAQALLDGAD